MDELSLIITMVAIATLAFVAIILWIIKSNKKESKKEFKP